MTQDKVKKEKQKSLILGSIVGLLIILFIFVNDPFGLFEKGLGTGQPLFPQFNSETVAKVVIKDSLGTIVMIKDKGDWKVFGKKLNLINEKEIQNFSDIKNLVKLDGLLFEGVKKDELASLKSYNMNISNMDNMLKAVKGLKEEKIISQNTSKLDIFKVGKEFEVVFQAFDKSEKEMAAFVIGKSGSDFTSQYFRKRNSPKVLVHARSLLHTFKKPVKDWRDKTIMEINPKEIVEFSWEKGRNRLGMKKIEVEEPLAANKSKANKNIPPKKTEKWQLTYPQKGFAQKSIADNMARTFAKLKARDFEDDEKAYKGKKVTGSIVAKTRAGAVFRLDALGQVDKKSQNIMVRREGNTQIFLINEIDLKRMTKDVSEVLEKPKEKQKKKR